MGCGNTLTGTLLSSGLRQLLRIIIPTLSFVFPAIAISLTLDLEHSSLCSEIVLICSFDNVHFVRFEESVAEERFSTLTSNYIASNPDYEEVASDGLYRLRITQLEKYNSTRYRCNGFNEDLSQVFRSDEWKLIVPCELNQITVYVCWNFVIECVVGCT